MKSAEVQTSADQCYLVVYMHVNGAERYWICNNDVTARLNLEKSHQQ